MKQRRWSTATEAKVTSRPARVVADLPTLWISRLVSCTGHEAWVQSVDWSPRGDRLASVSNDATLRIWDAATCAELECRELRAQAQALGVVAVG